MPQSNLTDLERDAKAIPSLDAKVVSQQQADELVHSSGQGLSNLHLLSGRKVPSIEHTINQTEGPGNLHVDSPRPNSSTPKYRNDLSPDKLGVVGCVTETVTMAKELISNRIKERRASIEAKETPENSEASEQEVHEAPAPAQEPILVQKVKSLFPKPLVNEDGSPKYKIDDSWGYQHREGGELNLHTTQTLSK
ncbi:hypothetical protein K7432_016184 [Basidiobolus ranarum]|uniref:Uncharacterized protein n=1 Tax=Basidiobolus ranarum TaxID=34480 RepID=A0ABR2WF43_9FUNG